MRPRVQGLNFKLRFCRSYFYRRDFQGAKVFSLNWIDLQRTHRMAGVLFDLHGQAFFQQIVNSL